MVLRLLLAIALNIFNDDKTIWKDIIILVVLLIMIFIFAYLQPYIHKIENYMGCISITILMFNFVVASVINAEPLPLSSVFVNVQWFLFVVNFIIVVTFVVIILWHGKENIKRNFGQVKECFSQLRNKPQNEDEQRLLGRLVEDGD